MTVVGNRIPPEFFDRARRLAAEERVKAMAAFFTVLEHKLEALLKPQPAASRRACALPSRWLVAWHLRFWRIGG